MTRLPPCHWANSAKGTVIPMSGQWSKATSDQKWEKDFVQDRKFVVVPGLSSSSSASSSSTSFPQDSSSTSPSPARLRSDDTYYQAPGNRRDPPKIKKIKIKMRMTIKQRKIACETSRSGQRSSPIISKIRKCQHPTLP